MNIYYFIHLKIQEDYSFLDKSKVFFAPKDFT